MIFVTVGTQLAFDRLVHTVDKWAACHGRSDVFAQIGIGATPPTHIDYAETLSPEACHERFVDAQLIVSHAGMGSILTAMELGKPLVMMPRRFDRGEHRSDHQVATASRLSERYQLAVADDEHELTTRLERMTSITPLPRIASHASFELLAAVRAFIADEPIPDLADGDAEASRTPREIPRSRAA